MPGALEPGSGTAVGHQADAATTGIPGIFGRPIELDCDVLFGTWPPRAQLAMDLDTVRTTMAAAGVTAGAACSARGAWFDDVEGNSETIQAIGSLSGWYPVATINLRNALRAVNELDRVSAAGVRALRLFGPTQGGAPTFPGYRHIVDEAVRRGMVLMMEGDVRTTWTAFAGKGARVVFLDVHAYHVADFILLARSEPGFVASTRVLNAPDSIETVAGEVGAAHLAFGSRTPLHSLSPATIRLRRARLSESEWQAVAGGTLRSLLEEGTAGG